MRIVAGWMASLGLPLNRESERKLFEFRQLVLSWNKKVNLTNITDLSDFEEKHFLDSLLACAYPEFLDGKTIIDIGTGAGFPGIPLAICFPEKQYVLIDSLNKRIKILKLIIEDLALRNVELIHTRAEDLAMDSDHREKYDFSLSRAVANMSVLAEYCLPFVRLGGYFGAYKTADSHKELDQSMKALNILGGQLKAETSFPKGISDLKHHIYWICKIKPTPTKYPRKAGIPSKEPII